MYPANLGDIFRDYREHFQVNRSLTKSIPVLIDQKIHSSRQVISVAISRKRIVLDETHSVCLSVNTRFNHKLLCWDRLIIAETNKLYQEVSDDDKTVHVPSQCKFTITIFGDSQIVEFFVIPLHFPTVSKQ